MAPSSSKNATARLELIKRAMDQSSRMPFIRPYRQEDQEAVMHICRVTAHPSATKEPVVQIVPFIFALPYVVLYPSYTFILDSGYDEAVGYCVAVPCTKTYLRRYKDEYLPTVDRDRFPPPIPNPKLSAGNEIESQGENGNVAAALLQRLYSPDEALLHREWPQLLDEYPAHLHIDILPEFQGHGRGRALMDALMEKLKEDHVKGIHLMKAGENTGTELFYSRVGFQRYPEVMDGGASGEIGRKRGGGVCMIQKAV